MSVEGWATLATALIGIVALVFEHMKTRSPNKEVSDTLADHARRIKVLENWKNS